MLVSTRTELRAISLNVEARLPAQLPKLCPSAQTVRLAVRELQAHTPGWNIWRKTVAKAFLWFLDTLVDVGCAPAETVEGA